MEQAQPNTVALNTLYFAIFLDKFGALMIQPIMPFLALSMKASAFDLGLMTSIYSLAEMLGTIVLGVMSDKIGRRKVLVVCLGTTTLALVCFAFAQNITQLMVFRALEGFFCGTMGTSQAFIADLVPPDSRSAALSKSGAAMGAGLVMGPAVGGLLSPLGGFKCVALFGAALTLVNTILATVSLPYDQKAIQHEKPKETESIATTGAPSVWSVLLQEKMILAYFACNFLYMLAFGFFMGIFALFLHDLYGMGASQLGLIFMSCGAAMIILQLTVTKKAVELLGDRKVMILGIASRVVTFTAYVFIHASWVGYVLTPFLICGSAFFLPTIASLTSALAPEEVRGTIMGCQNALGSLASMLGPVVAGALYMSDKYSPFVAATWINVVGMALAIVVTGSKPAPLKEPLLQAEDSPKRKLSRRPSQLELMGDSTAMALPPAMVSPGTGAGAFTLDPK